MLKVVHVHTDLKFLDETERFNRPWFENTIVIIGKKKPYDEFYSNQAILVSHSSADLAKVVTICSGADVVVLYDLDYVKSYLALKIPRNITIAWRFFGYELYNRTSMVGYLSANSLKFHKRRKDIEMISEYKKVIAKFISRATRRPDPENIFADAMKRIDLFLGLSKYEYDHLTQTWNSLPPFVQAPFSCETSKRHSTINDNLVIVGNSRSIYNNHIDVIDLIEKTKHSNEMSFLIPFSYGDENYYTNEIRRRVDITRQNIVLLETFMPRESYFELITKAKAAVSNSYRQLGMGNIFEFINAGMKIYLSNHNVIYQWFIDLGLRVYTIENFGSDLESNDLELSSQDKDWNCRVLKQMASTFSQEQFVIEMRDVVRKKTG